MEPKTKSFPATFKSLGPDDNEPVGTFEAMVAVFDNVDKVGDRLKSTAFDNTLERWRQSGDPIPVILSHNWDDPFAIIGHADPNQVKAVEGRGLYVKGQIDHLEDNPVAAQVHRLMGSRRFTSSTQFCATTIASTSSTASSCCSGTPIVCITRRPARTRLLARSVAPVTSSAMHPSMMSVMIGEPVATSLATFRRSQHFLFTHVFG